MSFLVGSELKKVYQRAQSEGYALMANNFTEENILVGLLDAYTKANSDLVVQVSPEACAFAGRGNKLTGLKILSGMVHELAFSAPIGVALNLDHFTYDDREIATYAAKNGLVSSVMIDASKNTFKDNVCMTQEVASQLSSSDVLLEAELGKMKELDTAGCEDDLFYVNPDQVVEFVALTGIDLLAIAIGTQHGVSKGRDLKLRIDLVKAVKDRLDSANYPCLLVLHGTSGMLPAQIREVISHGVCKLNISTLYQYQYSLVAHNFYRKHCAAIAPPNGVDDDVKTFFSSSDWKPSQKYIDLHTVGRSIRDGISKVATDLIMLAGSGGYSIRGVTYSRADRRLY